MTLYRGELPGPGTWSSPRGVRRTTAAADRRRLRPHLRPGDALAVARRRRCGPGRHDCHDLRELRRVPASLARVAAAPTACSPARPSPRGSWLESCVGRGLPPDGSCRAGIPQVDVHDAHGRFLGRVDGYWPELGVVARGRRPGQVPRRRRPGRWTAEPDAVGRSGVRRSRRTRGRPAGVGAGRGALDHRELARHAGRRSAARLARARSGAPIPAASGPPSRARAAGQPVTECEIGTAFRASRGASRPRPSRTKSGAEPRGSGRRGGRGGRRRRRRRGRLPGR